MVLDNAILSENQAKRLSLPLPLLFFFSTYAVWQMGVVYFSGEALSIGGRTPLPVSIENMTLLIASKLQIHSRRELFVLVEQNRRSREDKV